ncbi:hypothetical protein SAMN05216264_10867 [Pseudomonas marincola]|nr:hypothetical protein SAMN05216264_10867 [Pseudomonas marincola]
MLNGAMAAAPTSNAQADRANTFLFRFMNTHLIIEVTSASQAEGALRPPGWLLKYCNICRKRTGFRPVVVNAYLTNEVSAGRVNNDLSAYSGGFAFREISSFRRSLQSPHQYGGSNL